MNKVRSRYNADSQYWLHWIISVTHRNWSVLWNKTPAYSISDYPHRLFFIQANVGLCQKYHENQYTTFWLIITTPHHNRNCFTALFPGPSGWAGARRKLLVFMVQGKINRGRHTDHPAGRHSIQTNQCPPPPSPIFTGRMPFLPPNQQCQSNEGN